MNDDVYLCRDCYGMWSPSYTTKVQGQCPGCGSADVDLLAYDRAAAIVEAHRDRHRTAFAATHRRTTDAE